MTNSSLRDHFLSVLQDHIVGGTDGDTDRTVWYATASPAEIAEELTDVSVHTIVSEAEEAHRYIGVLRMGIALITDRARAEARTLSSPSRYGYEDVGRQLRALLNEPLPLTIGATGVTEEISKLLQASGYFPPPGGAATMYYAVFQGPVGSATWVLRSTVEAAHHTAHVFGTGSQVAKRVVIDYADGASFCTAWQAIPAIDQEQCTVCEGQFTID